MKDIIVNKIIIHVCVQLVNTGKLKRRPCKTSLYESTMVYQQHDCNVLLNMFLCSHSDTPCWCSHYGHLPVHTLGNVKAHCSKCKLPKGRTVGGRHITSSSYLRETNVIEQV